MNAAELFAALLPTLGIVALGRLSCASRALNQAASVHVERAQRRLIDALPTCVARVMRDGTVAHEDCERGAETDPTDAPSTWYGTTRDRAAVPVRSVRVVDAPRVGGMFEFEGALLLVRFVPGARSMTRLVGDQKRQKKRPEAAAAARATTDPMLTRYAGVVDDAHVVAVCGIYPSISAATDAKLRDRLLYDAATRDRWRRLLRGFNRAVASMLYGGGTAGTERRRQTTMLYVRRLAALFAKVDADFAALLVRRVQVRLAADQRTLLA